MKTALIGALILACGTAIADVQKEWPLDPGAGAEEPGGSCGEAPERKGLDTALLWWDSIDTAQRQARGAGKLVLALHVSGHFDRPGLT